MNKNIFLWNKKSTNRLPFFVMALGLLFVISVSLACNAPAEDETLRNTQIALNVQATQLALQGNQPNAQPETEQQPAQEAEATQLAADVQSTVNAQITIDAANAPDTAAPTDPPPPTDTPEPVATDPPPTDAPANIDEMIKESNILLFENVTKIPLPRYIEQALNNLGLGRNYVDVKDAPGNFKAQLLSGTDWDLIVVGVEARSSIEGEFFDYFNDQVNKGTGLVIELWDLDEIAGAKATSFLTNCGIKVQGDWYDPPMTSRSIWWLYGEHPVFHEPNEGMSLVNYSPYWSGDAGDLLKTIPGSDAILLAGTYAQEKSSHGLLAVCHDDRVIVQTYSSHDYRQDDVVRLWENYIYNALRAHFEYELSQ